MPAKKRKAGPTWQRKSEVDAYNERLEMMGISADLAPLTAGFGSARGEAAPRASSMLVHLGAFLGDLGILMQQVPAAPPAQEQKKSAAKAALIEEVERLRGQIEQDAAVPAAQKRESLRKLDQAIGGIRACNTRGLNNASFDIAAAGDGPGMGRPWENNWRQVWIMALAVLAKSRWDDDVPAPNQAAPRVEYDPQTGTIWFMVGTVPVTLIGWGIHANKADQARQVAVDLDAMFRRCDYPDKAMADRIANLRNP
jgi:hypothetical protein